MKTEIETDKTDTVELAGIIVESETAEERVVLERLWCNRGRMMVFERMPDGNVQLTVAPTEVAHED